jgi:hypothetical protein
VANKFAVIVSAFPGYYNRIVNFKCPPGLSASLSHLRNIWWYGAYINIEYQYIRHFSYCPAACFRGYSKLNHIPNLEMTPGTDYSAAEKKGISRRYQFSIGELFFRIINLSRIG